MTQRGRGRWPYVPSAKDTSTMLQWVPARPPLGPTRGRTRSRPRESLLGSVPQEAGQQAYVTASGTETASQDRAALASSCDSSLRTSSFGLGRQPAESVHAPG